MLDLIGKSLESAKNILNKNGFNKIKVICTNSDKQKTYDTEIVIRQKFYDDYVELVVTNVLINI